MRRASFAAGALAAAFVAFAWLRHRSSGAGRVDVYHEDGSMISLDHGDPRGERMLALAAAAIRAVRAA